MSLTVRMSAKASRILVRRNFVDRGILRRLGLYFLRLAGVRMEKGLGSDGGPMVYPGAYRRGVYQADYATLRLEGRKSRAAKQPVSHIKLPGSFKLPRIKGVKGGRVIDRRTLTFTGRMKAARGIKAVEKNSVVIGWPAGEEATKALGNERRHPWIKATPDERAQLAAFVKAEILAQLNKTSAPAIGGKGTK